MSIMTSPFDVGAEMFAQKYAAPTGEFDNPDNQSQGIVYDTAQKIRSGWRNCALTTSQAKEYLCGINSDACGWSDGEWTDFLESELATFYPVRRYTQCEVSAWSSWSDCVAGTQTRTRTVTQPKLHNCVEKPCEMELTEERSCEGYDTNDEAPDDQDIDDDDTIDDWADNQEEGELANDEEGCPRGNENREAADKAGDCGDCLEGFIEDEVGACVEDTSSDDESDSLADKIQEHWVLIGLGLVGLALLG